jgi:carbamoyltransferase
VAASVQDVLEEMTIASLDRIMQRTPAQNLALCGGVFANVKLTQRIAERFPFKEIFVYPAMSDQGEAAGGALEYLLARDGLKTWLANRSALPDVYLGRDYTAGADDVFRAAGAEAVLATSGGDAELAQRCAKLIVEGKTVGTYLGRGEYGPRALGARSIMASAVDRKINDWLNQRLERTEFMPFAPVVRQERCTDLFNLPQSLMYTAQFMTVTCNVKPEWKDRIPAVVHVDGTARPQVVARETNPLYYDIIHEYERLTGIPALINTSFNVHEEPIINRPQDALKALQQGRVDYVVTERTLWKNR